MQTSLLAIANKAKDRKHYRFLNLYRLIDENLLLECWSDIRKNAAYGVDRVSAQQYGENLIDNIRNLIERLKRKSYRARLVRRHYIPRPDGRMRPLGIPVVEDNCCSLRSRGYSKPSTSRISCDVAMGIVRTKVRLMPSTS